MLLKKASFDPIRVIVTTVDGKKITAIKLGKNQTLNPNKEYSVLLNKPSKEGLSVFDSYHKKSDWEKELDDAEEKQIAKYDLSYTIPDIAEVQALYNSALKKHYDKIDSLEAILNEQKSSIDKLQLGSLYSLIQCLETHQSKVCINCESSNLIDLLMRKSERLGEIAFGAKSIDGKKRAQKCSDSLAILNEHLVSINTGKVRLLGLIGTCDFLAEELDQFVTYAATLNEISNTLTEKCKQKSKIEQAIFKQYFYAPYSLEINTLVYNFKTRAATRIIPDFGLIVYGFDRSGYHKDFTGFSPVLGFRINLRPIDKNIPWKVYPDKTIWHYLAVTSGWTLASVAEKGEREDLFKSSSFYTGLGVKLYSHAIVLNAGALFFNKIDPNPVSNNKEIAATGYIGISVDLELKSFFNGLGDLF